MTVKKHKNQKRVYYKQKDITFDTVSDCIKYFGVSKSTFKNKMAGKRIKNKELNDAELIIENINVNTQRINSKINQYDSDGNYIKTWNSALDIINKYDMSLYSMLAVLQGYNKSSKGYLWKYLSEEFPKNKKIEPLDKKCYKHINQYELNGDFIATYKSITEASKKTNVLYASIVSAVMGFASTGGSFQWRYESKEFPTGKNIDMAKNIRSYKVLYKDKNILFNSLKACSRYFDVSYYLIRAKVLYNENVQNKELQNANLELFNVETYKGPIPRILS